MEMEALQQPNRFLDHVRHPSVKEKPDQEIMIEILIEGRYMATMMLPVVDHHHRDEGVLDLDLNPGHHEGKGKMGVVADSMMTKANCSLVVYHFPLMTLLSARPLNRLES